MDTPCYPVDVTATRRHVAGSRDDDTSLSSMPETTRAGVNRRLVDGASTVVAMSTSRLLPAGDGTLGCDGRLVGRAVCKIVA